MTTDEEQVDAHNRRALWEDIARHLRVSHESLEHAQQALEDLKTYGVEGTIAYADQLQPLVDAIRRAASDAEEQVGRR